MLERARLRLARRPDGRRRARRDPVRRGARPAGRGSPSRPPRAELRALAAANRPAEPMIGLGYHGTITPPVIRRNVLEDPSWYTAYTPYQPEISQGRLEALLNFQTVVGDLTGLPTANASLLDEGTAAAEAMTLVRRGEPEGVRPVRRRRRRAARRPSTWSAPAPRRWASRSSSPTSTDGLPDGRAVRRAGAVPRRVRPGRRPAPGDRGRPRARRPRRRRRRPAGADAARGARRARAPTSSSAPPSGSACRCSTAARTPASWPSPTGLERHLPGRLVGVSVDAEGRPAYRLALQTREQHIRRDKATSNICTAQVLLAVVAVDVRRLPRPRRAAGDRDPHPPLRRGAGRGAARRRRRGRARRVLRHRDRARRPGRADEVVAAARELGLHLRLVDADRVGISTSETTTRSTLTSVLRAFGVDGRRRRPRRRPPATRCPTRCAAPRRTSPTRSSRATTARPRCCATCGGSRARDYALDRGMIPLGSCTMKLNATTEMEPVSLPGFADLHPFAPAEDARRLPQAGRPTWSAGWPRSPATTGSRSSPTPARRASWPDCWPSAATTAPTATRRAQRLPDPVVRARHQRRLGGDGRHEGRRREGGRRRLGRPRRPARRSARRTPTTWPRSW